MTTAPVPPAAAETPLYLVEAQFDLPEFYRWLSQRGFSEEDWGLHTLLTETFGQGQSLRPYRLLLHRSTLYGYSRRPAAELQEELEMAGPTPSRIIPAEGIRSKPTPAGWQPGRRLGFEVRLCPLKRAYLPEAGNPRGKPSERDLYAWRLQRKKPGETVPPRAVVYGQWLQYRLEKQGGARLEQAALKDYFPLTTRRAMNRSPITIPIATMEGVLTVTDSAKFRELLGRGVGRHIAYGYGMLLIKPAANIGPARIPLHDRPAAEADPAAE